VPGKSCFLSYVIKKEKKKRRGKQPTRGRILSKEPYSLPLKLWRGKRGGGKKRRLLRLSSSRVEKEKRKKKRLIAAPGGRKRDFYE